MVGCIDHAGDDVAVLAETARVENGDRHYLYARVTDTRDAGAVVCRGGDDAGHGGAVAVGIDVRIGAGEDGGASDELAGKVRVRGVNAGVEEGDYGATGRLNGPVDLVPPDLGE